MAFALEDWVALKELEGMGPTKKLDLIKALGDPALALEAAKDSGLGEGLEKALAEAHRILTLCEKKEIQVIALSHEAYPELLKYISDPPLVLYVKGTLPDNPSLGVVGSRRASSYGIDAAVKFSSQLCKAGFSVVSGMARGIDTAAHCGALKGGGPTAAVLGCGPDFVYPPENAMLMERIAENGAVLSEYAPGTEPRAFHFPCRNRIISGMCLGVMVVEAGVKSGSLITAQTALEQGREVFAVPGNLSSFNSRGTNKLIQDGAKLVLALSDILEEFGMDTSSLEARSLKDTPLPLAVKLFSETAGSYDGTLTVPEKEVLINLGIEDLFDEEMGMKTGMKPSELSGVLLSLELKGLIQRTLSGRFRRTL